MVTVPNAVNSVMRRNLIGLGEDGFQKIVKEVVLRPGSEAFNGGIRHKVPCRS
jgi:hypothetical protein